MPLRTNGRRKQQLGAVVSLVAAALLLPLAPLPASPPRAHAVPVEEAAAAPSAAASLTVTLSKPSPSVAPTGTMQITVSVSSATPIRDLSVRLRVRHPSGKLMYQKTEERSALKPGATAVGFSRPLGDLELKEGRYAIEAYVEADELRPVTVNDRLYVMRADRRPLTLAVVARFDPAPMVDPEGRFAVDPAQNTRTRDEAAALAAMLARSPQLRLTLGMPPLVLEEWRRVTSGYRTIGPEGERSFEKDGPVPSSYAAALDTLKRAAADPRLELLDVPFADPDLGGLRSMGAVDDLAAHYERGVSVYQVSLAATPSAGTAVLGDSVPSIALPVLARERIGHVLLRPSALLASRRATAAPGVYSIAGSPVRALVIDERVSASLADPKASSEELLDQLFTQMTAKRPRPVVASVRLGPGARTDVAALESRLRELAGTGWVRFSTTAEVATTTPAAEGRLQPTAYPGRPAPAGYWSGMTEARRYAGAFVDAVSLRDEDAAAALYGALVAESRCWAGPDDRWGLADRGRAFADASLRSSRQVLDRVSIATQTITLSGSAGKIPLSVKNASGKTLQVEMLVSSSGATFPSGGRVRATLRPADNYLTVPVDLGSGSVYEDVDVSIVSGRVTLASTRIGVRASYLDRLAIIATVVLVLVALLFYIRRKVRAAEADT